MKQPLLFGLILAALCNNNAVAQEQPPFTCRTNDPVVMGQLHQNDPAIIQAIADANAELEAFTANYPEGERSTYTVPVVFHIIHNNGEENISNEQVFDAMRVLNEDFNKLNPDWDNVRPEFLSIVANVSVEFKLARKDPNGNCTNGITRTLSTLTYDGTQTMKDLIQWPRNKYLNVWVAASADGAAGYTLTPGGAQFFSEGDGIVMLHTYVGAIGTGSVSRSRALTHEVGHWINLEHTWGSSNTPAVAANCSDDDNVTDTPNTIGWTSCNLNGATCGSPLDNVENYMDYSYCSKMFTNGQKTRMTAALNSGTAQRNQIIATSNLTATGVNQPDVLCAAVFSSTTHVICAGGTVTFSDDSYNAVTSRTWTFPGGTPGTSTAEDPVVTYITPGVYAVTLSATDGSSTQNSTQNTYVTVMANPGTNVPFVEGFESVANLTGPEWLTSNPNNDNTFGLTSVAAYSGSKSTRIVNTAAQDGRFDELVSSTYDMSAATDIVVSFRYAFAKRVSTNDDALTFYVSNDCGTTWALRKILRGSTNLTTGGTTSTSFIPNSTQWGYAEVTNISSTSNISNFRFKFEFESDGGNNLYLDDININGAPVGVEELSASAGGLFVVPNPAADDAQAVFTITKSGPVQVDLLDMTGRLVQRVQSGNMVAGTQRIDLPLRDLQAGIYFIRLQQGSEQRTNRFVVK